ncbi:tryptophan halogenase [Cellvibrio mixtus]|uniref:Tryptophan halogenase n=1 Tax=Cellvibrio mixtus TaxID=39650 RepID=A0A266Q8S6_9GAMM|nr:tryptophan halogenase family protein [Cellvibrio mixtus]OZY86016.1 tryptophan halogenase [Cellvibrio mixtus]
MSNSIKKIIIVGGGTAGWLAAGLLAAEFKHAESSIEITLIESPDVNTIGVGEGTWPSMRATLRKIGISETELVRECFVSFKQGSKFVGWRTGASDDVYHHPFSIPHGYAESNLAAAWQAKFADHPFAEIVSSQFVVAEHGCAPKQVATPEYAGVLNYGYHLDAGKFAVILQRHCTANLGVKHILDHVTKVVSADNGDIAAVDTKATGIISGDLFIDCSGLSCLLLGQHFGVPFVDKKHLSLNDTALAMQVPYPEKNSPIESCTVATAQSAGWTWDIGLSSRRGVGYVFSSGYISEEQAERELRAHIAKSVGAAVADSLSSKKLSIRAGHRQEFWHKNCVAVGMSAGFIEPLEASALALVELSMNMICEEFPVDRSAMSVVAKRFNEVFCYRWERIIDFLKLHYALTERRDSDYWRDMSSPEALPDRLRELLVLWKSRPPHRNDFIQVEEIFPSASYQYVLYGMGFKMDASALPRTSDNLPTALARIRETAEKTRKFLSGLPSNRALIDHVMLHGMPLI